ncbi:hypothetical protein P3L10_012084 [Capsicum annuum]
MKCEDEEYIILCSNNTMLLQLEFTEELDCGRNVEQVQDGSWRKYVRKTKCRLKWEAFSYF